MKTLLIPALLALAAGSVAAQTTTTAPAPMTPPATTLQQAGGVSYMNGGVGDAEQRAMNSRAQKFPLQVILSGKNEQYVVADALSVFDSQGQLMTVIENAGPLVWIDVPAGTYTLQARFDDQNVARERTVTVGQGDPKLYWSIPGAME